MTMACPAVSSSTVSDGHLKTLGRACPVAGSRLALTVHQASRSTFASKLSGCVAPLGPDGGYVGAAFQRERYNWSSSRYGSRTVRQPTQGPRDATNGVEPPLARTEP